KLTGYMLNWILHGALSIQTYHYYLAFPKDRIFIKVLVYGVYFIEVIQSSVATYDAFTAFGSGNFSRLSQMRLSGVSGAILGGLIACIGQSYYAYRIRVLSRSRVIPLFVILISMLQLAAGLMTGILVCKEKNASELRIISYTWTGSSALCDAVIACYMTFFLLRQDTDFKTTRRLLRRLVRLSVETGVVTASMAITTLVLITAFPIEIYFMAVAGTISKWYSNTLLVILNSR
ncbi:hypothetical protein BDQ12DRAFT_562755, partial [Crucibulum laeve]